MTTAPTAATAKENPVPTATAATAQALISRARAHLLDYSRGSGSGLDSDACVDAGWHLRRDVEDLLPLLEQLLAQDQEPAAAPVLTLTRSAA